MHKVNHTKLIIFITSWILTLRDVSCGLNLGHISDDYKALSSQLAIKKLLRQSPITFKINSVKSPLHLVSPSKLPKALPINAKLKTLSKLRPIKTKLSKIPKIPPILPILPPIIPKLPLPLPILPIIPPLPILPLPIIPPLPILTLPIIPRLPKTLKTPKLVKKTALQKALESTDMKFALKAPPKLRKNISKILLDLKKSGSLTTAEYLRFKKRLL